MKTILMILLSLALVVPHTAQDNDASPFLIGMLRPDGTLVPFAKYGNGGWWNPWPKVRHVAEDIYAESTEISSNHSLSDLSEPWFTQCGVVPTEWFFWSSAGELTTLSASKVVRVTAHSGTNWGLLTDLQKRTSEDPLHDIVGVAVTVQQKIEPFIAIEPASAQGKEMSAFINQLFDVQETSLTKLSVSSSLINDKHIYYVNAEKQSKKRTVSGDSDCTDVSLFQGWFSVDERGGMGVLASNVVVTDCDRKGTCTMIPVGLMKLKDQNFLFVREHCWEEENYIILELNRSRLERVLTTVGA